MILPNLKLKQINFKLLKENYEVQITILQQGRWKHVSAYTLVKKTMIIYIQQCRIMVILSACFFFFHCILYTMFPLYTPCLLLLLLLSHVHTTPCSVSLRELPDSVSQHMYSDEHWLAAGATRRGLLRWQR